MAILLGAWKRSKKCWFLVELKILRGLRGLQTRKKPKQDTGGDKATDLFERDEEMQKKLPII